MDTELRTTCNDYNIYGSFNGNCMYPREYNASLPFLFISDHFYLYDTLS